MSHNGIWYLTYFTIGYKAIGCKWVFKTKLSPDGKLRRYKARLVAKDYRQTKWFAYKETFLHVSTKDAFRVIIALVAHFNLKLHQMDVKTSFMNRELIEDVYMIQPEGFIEAGKEKLV